MIDKYWSKLLSGIVIFIAVLLTCFGTYFFKIDLIYIVPFFSLIFAIVGFFCGILSELVYKIYVYFSERDLDIDNFSFDYYREVIDNYSISNIILCYGKVDYRDELVCLLLKLIIDKKILIVNNKIEIISEEGFNQSETMLIKMLKGFKVYGKNIGKDVHDDNINDSLECDLFCNGKVQNGGNIYFEIICFVAFLVGLLLLLIIFSSYIYEDEFMVFILFGIAVLLVVSILYLSSKYKRIINRSEKGLEVRRKLFGLRNFLKDFSKIDDRSIKELGLWEYYMIYALIFNIKGNLNDEAKEFYQKYISSSI